MNETQLSELISPILAEHGLELDALDSQAAGRRRLLRITVDGDGPEGRGPSLDDISLATRAISNTLDETDAMGERSYTLEVSSRGVSKPLTEPRHWRRNRGRLVLVNRDEQEPLTGRILDSDDHSVRLEVTVDPKRGSTTEQVLELSDITKAQAQVELNRSTEDRNQEEGS